MKKKRMMKLAMTIAVLAVSSQAMAACQQAKDAATQHATTAQEERTANQGATNASAANRPGVVTTLMAWGNNYDGQLGDETNGNSRTTPVKVVGPRGAKVEEIAGGASHTLALKEDGTVLAWGYNRDGELGDGTNEDNPTPVQVKDFHDPSGRLSGVRAIAAGSSHSLALKEDGTVWAWGYNYSGQLGDGTEANSTRPVRVDKLEGIEEIAAGAFFSLALKEDGSVWAWGSNASDLDKTQVTGQLGKNAVTSSDEPMEVGGLGGVEEIAAGSSHALALKDDGTVWAWGDDFFGELGDGRTETHSPEPVRVRDLEGVGAIEGGGWFSLALKDDGTVRAWGYNQDGELGNGSAPNAEEAKCENTAKPGDPQVVSSCADSPSPVQVSGLGGGVEAIAAGASHALALKEDGTVWVWGSSEQGQLGNGTKTEGTNTLGINTPLKVKDLGEVELVAAGLDFSFAGSK